MKRIHRVLTGPASVLFNKGGDFDFFFWVTYKAAQPRELKSATNYTISSQRHATSHSQLHFNKRHYTIKQRMKLRTEMFTQMECQLLVTS